MASQQRTRVEECIWKRGRSYEIRVSGEGLELHGRAPTLELARKKRHGFRVRIASGDLTDVEPETLEAALDHSLLSAKTLGGRRGPLRPKGEQGQVQAAKFWRKLFGMRPVHTLRRAEVEDAFLRRAGVACVSARNELQFLKRTLREQQDRGQRIDEAIFRIRPPRCEARDGRALTPEQRLHLLSWVRPDAISLVEIGSLVGNRVGELFTARDDRLTLGKTSGVLHVPKGLAKENRDKRIPLCRTEVQLFRARLIERAPGSAPLVFSSNPAGRPKKGGVAWQHSNFHKNVWIPAREAASAAWQEEHPGEWDPFRFDESGEEDWLHLHDLRHTAITICAAAGMRIEYVARRVGHADGGALLLARYRHLFADEEKSELRKLDRYLAGDGQGEEEAVER